MSCLAKRIFGTAILTVLIAGTAATASAQQATFHLPFDAKWGTLVLPAGDYTVKLPTPSMGTRQCLVLGPVQGFVMTVSSDSYGVRRAPSDNNYLQLVKVNDVYYVSKYEDGSRANTFTFKIPKQSTGEQVASREVVNIRATGN